MEPVQTAQILKTMRRAVNELQAGAAPQTMPTTPVGGNGSGEGRERGATEMEERQMANRNSENPALLAVVVVFHVKGSRTTPLSVA